MARHKPALSVPSFSPLPTLSTPSLRLPVERTTSLYQIPTSPSQIFKSFSTPDVGSLYLQSKGSPSDFDYQHLLSRLDKAITSSTSARRYSTLTEDQPLTISLDTDEWLLVHVPIEGAKTPMQVTMQRTKGRVICYLGRNQDPTDRFYDDISYKDYIVISESGLRFRMKWVGMGFKCVSDCDFVLSVRFGNMPLKRNRQLVRTQVLSDLNELRKDEFKRQALFDHVDSLLAQRASARRLSRNHIHNNIIGLHHLRETAEIHREIEKNRREQAIERYKEARKERKNRGMMQEKMKIMKLETELRLQEEKEAMRRLREEQAVWLALVALAGVSREMMDRFVERKGKILSVTNRMKAAMVLQRCYRKVLLTINPKRLIRQRALTHLRFLTHLLSPILTPHSHLQLFSCISDSHRTNAIGDSIIHFLTRGNASFSQDNSNEMVEV